MFVGLVVLFHPKLIQIRIFAEKIDKNVLLSQKLYNATDSNNRFGQELSRQNLPPPFFLQTLPLLLASNVATLCLLLVPHKSAGRHNVPPYRGSIMRDEKPMYGVRFEVFMAVTMKNGVFWDVTSCGSCKNRRFGGM
jgi:hypothetical protein